MESAEIIKQTWQQLATKLTTRFNSEGYQMVQHQNDDPVFGSQYMIWSNNEEALRLTWDGKESWFLLEEVMLPISHTNLWTEIIVVPFNTERHDPLYVHSIIQDMLNSLD